LPSASNLFRTFAAIDDMIVPKSIANNWARVGVVE